MAMRWHTEANPLNVEFRDEAFRPLQAQQRDVGATLLVGHGHGACQEVIGIELEGWRSSFWFGVFHVSNGKPHPICARNSRTSTGRDTERVGKSELNMACSCGACARFLGLTLTAYLYLMACVVSSSLIRLLKARSAVAGTTPLPSSRSSSVRLSQVMHSSA